MAFLAGFVTPQDYGATGNGATDDTAAVQAAITAVQNAGGGTLFFPEGSYLCTPSLSTGVALTMTGVSAGYQNVTLRGANNQAATIVKNGNGVLLQMSGPSSSPSTGSTHCRYCVVQDLGFNGNAYTGAVVQAYYADNLFFDNVYFNGNGDIVVDAVEFWDSRFFNCVFGGSGSTTANASAPNLYLRCSSASSGFGASTGTTNDIVVEACRFEAFLTGALWVAQGTGSSSGPNSVFVSNCKMETSQLNGGPHLSVDANTRGAYVDGLYAYSGGFYSGYSTAQPVAVWSGQDSSLSNVLISSGSAATVSNGVTLNSTLAGQNAVVRNVTGTYTTAPTGNHVAVGTATGGFVVDNCHSNETDPSPINSVFDLLGSVSSTNVLGLSVGGDAVHRFVSNANGALSWGGGSLAADAVMGRPVAGVLGLTTGSFLIGPSDLGDNGVIELKLANATTVPTSNPTGGGVLYAVDGSPLWRNAAGVVSPVVSPSEFSASPTGCLGETIPRIAVNSAAQAIGANTGTVYMASIWMPAGIKITNLSWVTGTTAAGTPTHWWLGIANSSGLQLGHVVDQATAAIAASSLITKALSTTYTTTYTGTYYMLLSVTATTNPTASGIAAPTTMNVTSPLLSGVSTSAAQTTPGTDGTTSYVLPSAAGGIPYAYFT